MERIRIDQIRLDGGTQPRGRLRQQQIKAYADDMRAGMTFPPVEVVYDGQDYWLWDGFHRVHASRLAGASEIDAHVAAGTHADAQWLSYSANKANGLYRSNQDKRRAVEAAMGHPKAAAMSNVQIAEHCGVSEFLVRKLQGKSTSIKSKSPTRTGRDGRTINTARIGKGRAAAPRAKAAGGSRPAAPARAAKPAFTPVLGHSNPPPMMPLSLPVKNPQMAASTLIELFATDWLRVVAEQITNHLRSLESQQGETA